jgi:hypothetical protein
MDTPSPPDLFTFSSRAERVAYTVAMFSIAVASVAVLAAIAYDSLAYSFGQPNYPRGPIVGAPSLPGMPPRLPNPRAWISASAAHPYVEI